MQCYLPPYQSTVAAFKYRYKARDGSIEDAMPTMNVEVRKVSATATAARSDEYGH